ncbi:C4-dicarboxylate-binding periplasmic protein precursor [Thalassovita gelatinovora]|uniref:C4-dicarboxylate-binding periplasmic protein n=1 Tax=Thalassovita gelatinovora TaxID=53501 RepID=A0A0P1FPV0_THAGE|nr:TRAP transporter substrate-binding protein [Thalassovita gelatinovora]QIZ79588.1 TRAP transporter substrate-binding protein [Thalassovita gelatinovora]CUH63085.1 C4-dicarboxylate-binding periplasmic protein precursor [Thalassovita gelatinovora]SEQ15464.1 TRAP-type C4-dicarboxylate transport system, substrate-binding protein [Thalassovita gelatinovora]
MLKKNLTGLAAGFVLSLTASVADARDLAFAVFVPAASPTVQKIYQPWVDWFNAEATNDDVQISLFAGGTLGRNPRAQAQMVADGVADLALTVPAYTPGVFPDFDMFELPGFANDVREGSLASLEMHQEGLLHGYENYYVVAMYSSGAYMLHTRDAVNSIDDLSGMRIRVGGQIQTAVIESLGGVPQSMSAGEMAENIDRGLIDGAMSDASVARTFRVADVAMNHYDANLGVLVFAIVMNRDVYASLSDHAKELLAQSGQFIADRQIENYGVAINGNIQGWQDSADHSVVIPEDADRAEIATRVQPVIDMVAANASPGLIEAYKAKLKDIRNR